MSRITRKHYKHTPICNYCYPQYLEGKKLDRKKGVWIGFRTPKPKQPKHTYNATFTPQERENLKISNNLYLSDSIMVEYLD